MTTAEKRIENKIYSVSTPEFIRVSFIATNCVFPYCDSVSGLDKVP